MKPVTQAPAAEEVPELTLNLPEQNCECVDNGPVNDRTFFDRGYSAMVNGDHIEAVQHFQRYSRLEKSPMAQWESKVAIAYVSTLPHSPFYDPNEARKAHRKLQRELQPDWDLDERVVMMHMTLETFRSMERHMDDLQDANATLREDLQKREEAIKRLRELTLGQTAERQ
jgi:hypothetical protein